MDKEVILTGLRSNAEFHLGNYLGAIKPMVRLQHGLRGQYQLNMFVPDLHSFTTQIDHSKLYAQTIDNVRLYVAAGLDISHPDTYVYRQSRIPAHSELTWILSCFTYFGELSRMTQFKEKGGDQQDNISAGLFNYPVLMAADILLYSAKWVPVGEDQRQHLELTRDLAIRMNNKFAVELFTVPYEWDKQLEFVGIDKGVRIRSLRTPEKKMSKSVEDPAGTIMLSDNPDEAAKKIMSATTDSVGKINYDWETQPGIANLLQILALTQDKDQDEVNKEWAARESYGELKQAVADSVKQLLQELQTALAAVETTAIEQKLTNDEAKMSETANTTLDKVQKAVGLKV
jgi:tryptophanyl-tRNA synthetase